MAFICTAVLASGAQMRYGCIRNSSSRYRTCGRRKIRTAQQRLNKPFTVSVRTIKCSLEKIVRAPEHLQKICDTVPLYYARIFSVCKTYQVIMWSRYY